MIFRVSILLQRFPRGINVFRTSIHRSKSIISAQFIDLEKLWSLIKLAYRLSYTHLSWILVIDDSMAAIDHQLSKRVTIVKLARSSVPYFHALYKYHLTSALTLRHLPSYLTVSSSWRNFSTGRRRSPFNSRERERDFNSSMEFSRPRNETIAKSFHCLAYFRVSTEESSLS